MKYIHSHCITLQHRHRRGSVLLAVLWGLIVLSFIGSGLLHLRNNFSRFEHSDEDHFLASTILDAGINRALLGIVDERADQHWRIDGKSINFIFEKTPLTISIQDELGKIDLNMASQDLISGLLRSTGMDSHQADVLTDRILDWRDAAGLHHLNSGEDQGINPFYTPRHAPFQSINELKLVSGITDDVYAKILPALTVYSQHAQFEQATAPEAALMALPNTPKEAADAIIAKREVNPQAPINQTSMPAGFIYSGQSLVGRAFTVTASMVMGKVTITYSKTVRVTGDPNRPFLTLMVRK